MSVLEEIQAAQARALRELQAVSTTDGLEDWRIRCLGRKGAVRRAMQRLKEAPADQKPALGKAVNELKKTLQDALQRRGDALAESRPRGRGLAPDITLPGRRPRIGHVHIITQTVNEICDIFGRMGFAVAYGPEVEDERHNFDALNIPIEHPARDPLENFYIDEATMLRSQTSTVQIRVMEGQPPPVRIISPGRVYRPDTVDATHYFMFYQVEGLYVDEGVSMADLKTCLDQFCRAYFGTSVQTRFRPSFFPFTEPSAEIDILFHDPDGTQRWIELGGCGMVHPHVLEAVHYDSEKYTGYAFGMGIERMIMRKYDIPDIRLLYENDVRFLRQF